MFGERSNQTLAVRISTAHYQSPYYPIDLFETLQLGTAQNLRGTPAGFWEVSRSKKTIRPLFHGFKKLVPPLV